MPVTKAVRDAKMKSVHSISFTLHWAAFPNSLRPVFEPAI